jgi:hypothetical protein
MNQAEASRINGAKSNGPVTAEGRAATAQNARKHGLTGGTVVLPHESQANYDALRDSFLKRFRPTDATELDLIQEMVDSRWRLHRIEAMEAALIQKGINEQMEAMGENADPETARFLAYAELAENSKGLRLLNRYAKDLRRSYEKALKEFMELHCGDLDGGDLAIPPQVVSEAQPEPDYSGLRNKPGHRPEAFMKAILPYVQKQQIALGQSPSRKHVA